MLELSSLNNLFTQYVKGILEKRDFEGLIFKTILQNSRYFYLFDGDEEETIDYLCWLYPRLSAAIKNYKETGASFSGYICALVRCSVKEYLSRRADHYITEYAAWTAQAVDMEARESEPEYPENPEPKVILNPRQVLILLLKSYYFVSDDFLERIAPSIGVEKEKLKKMIEDLRKQRTQREEEIRILKERIHCQFYRCIAFEKRLHAVAQDSIYYEKMQTCLERARGRLAAMRKRLAGIRLDATNQQIAEVLGISKGTVASGLFALRSRLKINKEEAAAKTAAELNRRGQRGIMNQYAQLPSWFSRGKFCGCAQAHGPGFLP
jgi:DNA-directed RNA polymerase specialized sigma24 family protein